MLVVEDNRNNAGTDAQLRVLPYHAKANSYNGSEYADVAQDSLLGDLLCSVCSDRQVQAPYTDTVVQGLGPVSILRSATSF